MPWGKACVVDIPVVSSKDITVYPRTNIGWVEEISSVTALEVECVESKHQNNDSTPADDFRGENDLIKKDVRVSTNDTIKDSSANTNDSVLGYLPEADPNHLTEPQRKIAEKMLKEEADSFIIYNS